MKFVAARFRLTCGSSLILFVTVFIFAALRFLPVGPSSGQHAPQGYLDLEGTKLYYEIRGKGPVVVLIHDGLLHHEVWDQQWEPLSRQHTVIRYDRRGYGQSDTSKQQYSDVNDLDSLLNRLHLGKATLIGSSAGGNLAMRYCLEHPGKVERLILVGPVVSGLRFSEHFMRRNADNMRPLNDSDNVIATIERWTQDGFIIAPGNRIARQKFRELLLKNPQNLTHPTNLMKRAQYKTLDRLSEIQVPVLIIAGEADIPDVHSQIGAIKAVIDRARHVIIPNAGHLVYFEKPEEFNRIVLDFLSGR